MTAAPASSPAARPPATPERATPERSVARTPRAAEALAMSTRKSETASPLVAETTPTALRDVPQASVFEDRDCTQTLFEAAGVRPELTF